MTNEPIITDDDKRRCAERELAMRKAVYPKRVREGKMNPDAAAWETAVMAAIAADYRVRINGSH